MLPAPDFRLAGFTERKTLMSTAIAAAKDRRRADLPRADPQTDAPMASISREVELRAYERFVARGGAHGADLDDWLAAERELLASRSLES